MFESFYRSVWQHPVLLWLAPAWFIWSLRGKGRAARRIEPSFRLSLLVFAYLTVLDPLMTGPVVELLHLPGGVADAVMIFFVLFGDFRWFFFFEVVGAGGRFGANVSSKMLRAAGLSLIVPVLQGTLIRIFPESFENPHKIFLLYELFFFLLAVGFLAWRVRGFAPEDRPFKAGLCYFALSYYGLWASADALILGCGDVGFALRVIPNQLYYAFFLPFVYWQALRHAAVPRTIASHDGSSSLSDA